MDVKNKKTVLNDEAALYQHKENVSEKEKWQQMSGAKRWEHFKEYYLMKLIVTVIVLAVTGSILYTMLSPKPEMLFSVAIINDSYYQSVYEEVQEKFEEVLQLDPETQETLFDTGYSISVEQYGSIESLQKFAMYNAVGDLDVTIMPQSVFETYAPGDYFSPVAGHLPTDLYMALSEYLLECQRMDEDGNLIPDSETVFGIDISSTWIYEGQERTEPMVLAINLATAKEENIEKFLRLLFFPED
ncbi:MAG: hypothetical protein J6J42_14435 [Lachnospiraceae bacterium]|nr:hypothetical protein [Lachnospiraceae bacterium]